ncbi:hypothetical protein ACFO4L_03425 [Bacillus daqingensis]|uniref:Uncharacterized protein n=1 Tax=Bacillus daqingensis TaxID=872396 RepID=A0ABV9NVQ4_9BACI
MIRFAVTGAAAAALLTFIASFPVNSIAVSGFRSALGGVCGMVAGIVLFYIMNAVMMPLKQHPEDTADHVAEAAEEESFQEEDAE